MQPTAKFFLVGVICFGLGVGAVYAWLKFDQTNQENAQLKNQLQVTTTPQATGAAVTLNPVLSPTTKPTEKPEVVTGSISGTLGYPSEGIPPLEIYAIQSGGGLKFFKVKTKTNQGAFTIDEIDPGTYVVVAYPVGASPGLSGGYTKAVACGLSVECTDHSLIPVVVVAGRTSANVEVKDWYAPENAFPVKPE
jgi:hypothetical protein